MLVSLYPIVFITAFQLYVFLLFAIVKTENNLWVMRFHPVLILIGTKMIIGPIGGRIGKKNTLMLNEKRRYAF